MKQIFGKKVDSSFQLPQKLSHQPLYANNTPQRVQRRVSSSNTSTSYEPTRSSDDNFLTGVFVGHVIESFNNRSSPTIETTKYSSGGHIETQPFTTGGQVTAAGFTTGGNDLDHNYTPLNKPEPSSYESIKTSYKELLK